ASRVEPDRGADDEEPAERAGPRSGHERKASGTTIDRPQLRHSVFDAWADAQTEVPPLDLVVDICVPTPRWAKLVEQAFARWLVELRRAAALPPDDRMVPIRDALAMARRLRETETAIGKRLAAEIATEVMILVGSRTRFLPLL